MEFRGFVVAGPKCWNKLPVGLRDLSVGSETFARHLKHTCSEPGFSDMARTFEFVLHFVGCVTMSG